MNAKLIQKISRRFGQRRFSRTSWSQEAEDLILERYFGARPAGFYVDVGAHHPFRFSNTALFHAKGWRGLNIDALPGCMKEFNRHRPHDINLQLGVAAEEGMLTYYKYDEPALNGFVRNEEVLTPNAVGRSYKLIGSEKTRVAPLHQILNENLSDSQEIQLLTIDVEGLDFEVLKSNDWIKFRPEAVVVETDCQTLESLLDDDCYLFLREKDYRLYARTGMSAIFVSDRSA